MASKEALGYFVALCTLNFDKEGAKNCAIIKKDLERIEKLKKALRMYYEKCDFVFDTKKKMWKFDNVEYFYQEEYELLKELENE